MGAGLSRRRLLAGALAVAAGGPARAQPAPAPVLVISRRRVLRETAAGRALSAAETRLSSAFEARVDAAKSALEAREAELARQRGQVPRAEFRARTEAFDRAVRETRRETQRQAAELQKTFRLARERLVGKLAPILIAVLKDRGADAILDSDQILVARPGVDVTDEVIARFDAEVPPLDLALDTETPILPRDFDAPEVGPEDGADGG